MATRLRVLTLNVLGYPHASGRERHEILERGLDDLRPDVVALQEITLTDELDQVRDLLGPDVEVVRHPNPSDDGVGACLASRWPLRHIATLDLNLVDEHDPLPWAAAVVVEVAVPEPLGPILVVHHKPDWHLHHELVREKQALAVARLVEELTADRPPMPVILLGDLDAAPDTASIRFLTGRQSLGDLSVRYEDTWEAVHAGEPGHTFTPVNALVRGGEVPLERGRRIDYVMIRSGPHGPPLQTADCRLVFDRPLDGVWASDHFGVLADLALPHHPPGTWA